MRYLPDLSKSIISARASGDRSRITASFRQLFPSPIVRKHPTGVILCTSRSAHGSFDTSIFGSSFRSVGGLGWALAMLVLLFLRWQFRPRFVKELEEAERRTGPDFGKER